MTVEHLLLSVMPKGHGMTVDDIAVAVARRGVSVARGDIRRVMDKLARITLVGVSHDFLSREYERNVHITDNYSTTVKMIRARQIAAEIAESHGISEDDLVGHCRERRFSWPRQDAMREIHRETSLPLKSIGAIFGGRDHTTVIHGIRCAEARARGEVYRAKPSPAGKRANQ